MKKAISLHRPILFTTLLVGLLSFVAEPEFAQAQQPKGGEKLIQTQPVKNAQDLQNIEPGDLIVMSCPKCKESSVTVAETNFKGSKPEDMKNAQVHLCSSCDTKVVTKGHGKAAKDVLVHTCKSCGSKDVFCCVIKKGSMPTPGMADKK